MIPDHIAKAVASPSRPAADRARDAGRKPAETMAFAGVRPGMAVADWIPLGGNYSRLLSSAVGPQGRVYAIDAAEWDKGEDAAMASEPCRENVTVILAEFGAFAPPEPVDLVWTAQNYHDLHVREYGADPTAFNRLVHAALKPGGVYIVVDHLMPHHADDAAIADLHRIGREDVVAEITAAGFVLDSESDLLRSDADDHTANTLDERIKGRTDQLILRFRKP